MDARAWDERYATRELVWSQTPNQFVESELAPLSPGRALDVACGEGRNALWLAERGWAVTAVDFSGVALDKAATLLARRTTAELDVSFQCADALTYDDGAASYDLVLMAYLQLVAEQRRLVVRRSFEWVKPGGTLLFVAHDASNIAEGTGGPQDPAVLCTATDVLADLDGERFEVLRADRVARVVAPTQAGHQHVGKESGTAYDVLVRVVRT